MFDLIADIERYPEFLPGWTQARILERNDNSLYAEQQLQTGPALFRFHSTARLQPCSGIHISANDGPFRELDIDWRFAESAADHCTVTLDLMLAMRPGLINTALKIMLETGSSQLLPLFESRARRLYS